MKNTYITFAVVLFLSVVYLFNPALAVDFSLQPRLEAGLAQYSFESSPASEIRLSEPVDASTGFNFTQLGFKYSDTMPVLGAGITLFLNQFFLDFSGQFALDGESSALATFSGFTAGDGLGQPLYLSADPIYEASFDRNDIAISLGHSFDGGFSVFAGYKKSKTDFDTTYEGRIASVNYEDDGTIVRGGGRLFGNAKFNFQYDGPFIGVLQGWEFGDEYFFSGILTTSLALAQLDGEVEVETKKFGFTLTWAGNQEIPEQRVDLHSGGVANRFDTKGDALGFTLSLGWRGTTAVEGLSYFLNLSGYRYEFEAEDSLHQSDINETTVVYKAGFSYAF